MPDPIGSASRARDVDQADDEVEPLVARPRTRLDAGFAPPRSIDEDLAQFARNAKPTNDDVLYLGINGKSAAAESRALGAVARVRTLDLGEGNTIERNGTRYDLTTLDGVRAFAATLRLGAAKSEAIATLIARGAPADRSALAAIAAAWAPAERGASVPSRLVVSGHSNGEWVFGGGPAVKLGDLRELAKLLPAAARQVEDIHLSACSTSGAPGEKRASWTESFPNLHTVWGYAGAAPSPAGAHLQAWATKTRGRDEALRLTPDLAKESVAVWSTKRGYESATVDITRLRARSSEIHARVAEYTSGVRPADHDGLAEADYRALKAIAAHDLATPDEKRRAHAAAEDVLRMRYYESGVRGKFVDEHRATIDAGYAVLDEQPARFESLSRRDALAAIASFESRVVRMSPAPNAATELLAKLRALRALDESVVPAKWCE